MLELETVKNTLVKAEDSVNAITQEEQYINKLIEEVESIPEAERIYCT